jgi:hypothetical protein
MKTGHLGHFGLAEKAAAVAVVALVSWACRDEASHRGGGPTVTGHERGKALPGPGVTTPSPGEAQASPERHADLARRQTAWVQKPLTQGDNKLTPERVRRVEMSRFELTSLAQEAAMIAMGLPEAKRTALRSILTEFRDAVLLRIERPGEGKAAPTADELVDGIERADRDPASPFNVYAKGLRETLGEAGRKEFGRLEREERARLIAARRAFRNPVPGPAPPGGQSPSSAATR